VTVASNPRRRLIAAMGMTVFALTELGSSALVWAAPSAEKGTGPLAGICRTEIKRRFRQYLLMSAAGDPWALSYYSPDFRMTAHDEVAGSDNLVLHSLLLDDESNQIAAEMRVRIKGIGGRADMTRVLLHFYRLENGYIAAIRPAPEIVRFIPGGDEGPPPRPRPTGAPLPAIAGHDRMTAERFRDYLDRFGRFDERFVEYYSPDIIFAAAPAPAPLHGRSAILDFYRPLRANLGEALTVKDLVIDSEAGLMAAALTNRLTAYGKVVLPSRTLTAGDVLELSGAIVYGLNRGRISMVRDLGG